MKSSWIAGLLSLLVPGAGQWYVRQAYRGAVIFIAACITVLVTLWYAVPAWYIVPLALWLWNVLDAVSLTRGRRLGALLPIAIVLIMGYGIGWQVTGMEPAALANNINRARIILAPMLRPDFFAQAEITNTSWAPVEVPCGENPPPATNTVNGILVTVAPDCGKIGDQLAVEGSGLWPNVQTRIYWSTPIGERLPLGEGFSTPLYVDSDGEGKLQAQIQVPPTALSSAPDPTKPLEHRVYLVQARPQAELKLSENGGYVVEGIKETLFLALMSTTLGALGAIPVSFLAARNLMSANPVTFAVYVATRTVLNIVRSIEPLIIAIVFVVIVGLGPFAGVIAITMHTIAALGKLYSEVVEGIDPGPLEAIRAVGGNWVQMVRFGVIPQIVPPFASFTLFRWDINVRTSTIIGFVGGGGIGFFLYQWIIKADFRAVSSSFIAIAIIVIVLDFVSARIRARLV